MVRTDFPTRFCCVDPLAFDRSAGFLVSLDLARARLGVEGIRIIANVMPAMVSQLIAPPVSAALLTLLLFRGQRGSSSRWISATMILVLKVPSSLQLLSRSASKCLYLS